MTPKEKVKISKFLCLLLRHDPAVGNITVDAHGWASVQEVLRALKNRFAGITHTSLKEIVAEDDKQRYSFSGHEKCIRANQGHSFAVDLDLVDVEPPEYLFHGTSRKTLWMIRRDGILAMTRQFVHLSNDRETAKVVGNRHGGDPVVILIRAWDMHASGLSFFRSTNGVWLTNQVPTDYLVFEE